MCSFETCSISLRSTTRWPLASYRHKQEEIKHRKERRGKEKLIATEKKEKEMEGKQARMRRERRGGERRRRKVVRRERERVERKGEKGKAGVKEASKVAVITTIQHVAHLHPTIVL